MNKNYFYEKIQINLDEQIKNNLFNNKDFLLKRDKVENVDISVDHMRVLRHSFKRVANGVILFCISKTNTYNNLFFIYDNRKTYMYCYVNNILNKVCVSHITSKLSGSECYTSIINTNIKNIDDYKFYIIKKIDMITIYNNKIDNIINSYKLRLKTYCENVLTKYAYKTLQRTKLNLIKHLAENDVFINKLNNNRIYKRLDELNSDLKNLSQFTQKEYYSNININEIIKHVVNNKFNTNFSKSKREYYEELSNNEEYYFREIIRTYFYQMLEKNSSIVKYSKIREQLIKSPDMWSSLKNKIFDDDLYKQFEYLDNAENFDLI